MKNKFSVILSLSCLLLFACKKSEDGAKHRLLEGREAPSSQNASRYLCDFHFTTVRTGCPQIYWQNVCSLRFTGTFQVDQAGNINLLFGQTGYVDGCNSLGPCFPTTQYALTGTGTMAGTVGTLNLRETATGNSFTVIFDTSVGLSKRVRKIVAPFQTTGNVYTYMFYYY